MGAPEVVFVRLQYYYSFDARFRYVTYEGRPLAVVASRRFSARYARQKRATWCKSRGKCVFVNFTLRSVRHLYDPYASLDIQPPSL